jgi:hypothetical protein
LLGLKRLKMRLLMTLALAVVCSATTLAAIPNPDDAVAVSGIVQDRLKATDISVSMVSEPPYAVAYWKAGTGYSAGQALAKKSNGSWTIVQLSNIKFNKLFLQEAGVPPATAKALVHDLKVAGQ